MSSSSPMIASSAEAASPLFRLRAASICLRRAAVRSQASGFLGQPFRGQSASAEAKASESAS